MSKHYGKPFPASRITKSMTIQINGEKVTLEEYKKMMEKEMAVFRRLYFLRLNVSRNEYSTILLEKIDEIVDLLIENKFRWHGIPKIEEEE